MMADSKLLSLAGLCRRAGGVCPGTDAALTAIRSSRKPVAVIMASDVSERTRKQLTDKTGSYSVPLYMSGYTSDEIGHALGLTSPVAVFALTGKGPAVSLKGVADGECKRI